jgi:hypothetical protein
MLPSGRPQESTRSRGWFVVAIVAIVISAVVMSAALIWIWYQTTLQPRVTLTAANYVTQRCVPIGNGYYANRFNWTFTLVNTGTADGDASIGFLLDGNSLGYDHFLVPQHSQVIEHPTLHGSGSLSPSQCPSETPGLALASVAGGYVLDIRLLIESFVRPAATVGFTGAWLGFLQYQARRRKFSIFEDLGVSGWGVAVSSVFAAGFFANVLTLLLVTPYNVPVDWRLAILYGVVFSTLGIVFLVLGYQQMLLAGRRKQPNGM